MLRVSNIMKRLSHTHSKSIKLTPTLVSLQYTKNLGTPSCSDCIYFVPSETYNLNHAKCRKFAKQNIITNQIELTYADINRDYDSLCGQSAKYKETVNKKVAQILIPVDDNLMN